MTRPRAWRRRSRHLAGLAAVLASAACTSVGPNYALPEASIYARQQEQPLPFEVRGADAAMSAQSPIEDAWWNLYGDRQLDALVEQALQANQDLKVAGARLQQAQLRYEQARAAGGFDFGVEASVARGRISAQSLLLTEPLPPATFGNGAISASYQLDLFGKLQRGVEAARASAEAVQAARNLARITIAAAMAGTYIEICHGNHEIAVALHSLELQRRSRDVAARLEAAGRGTRVAVARADAQLALLQASLPQLQDRVQAAGYELATLLGRTPDQAPGQALRCSEAPALRQPIPVGDGASLLRRRPDVRRAERELAAATAAIGIATADLYPQVRLGASVGASGLLEDFGRPVTREWSIGPFISWSIPGRGAHLRVEAAKAGAGLAVAEFDKVVLDALRETQTVIGRYAHDLEREAALRDARDRAESAAADERRLYQAGRLPYLSSLDAERTLSSAEASLAAAEAQVSQDQIRLFVALGGGWHDGATPAGGPERR